MPALVLRGDARHLPLPDASVDLVVTSPPYFKLRTYTDQGGRPLPSQVGAEPTPAEFLESLWEVTAECIRVLKPGGSIFVNLGDKYAERAGPGRTEHTPADQRRPRRPAERPPRDNWPGFRPKSLLGLPWRYALGCIDDLGLILRAEIIWSKANGLPESVTDRVRRSHETWFHLTVQPRYYAAIDEIREPSDPANLRPSDARGPGHRDAVKRVQGQGTVGHDGVPLAYHPLGSAPGSVQELAAEPLHVPPKLDVDHFAAFPSWWPWWIIKGWSPTAICLDCGEGRRPVADKRAEGGPVKRALRHLPGYDHPKGEGRRDVRRTITGYACVCSTPTAPTRPAVILDPFGGTGTTAMMADQLGRHAVSVDLSADYCRLATWRIFESGDGPRLLAKHEGTRYRPAPPVATHPTLFG